MGFFFQKSTRIVNTQQQLGALRIQSSVQGQPIPVSYGLNRITPNLLWYGGFTAIPHTTSQSSGGKGGGGGTTVTTTTYTYTTGAALGLCEGPISGIDRAWASKKVTTTANLGLSEFLGTYSQSPWTYLTTNYPSEALYRRGRAYVAGSAIDLGESDSLPNFSFEVEGLLYRDVCTPDANPAAVMYDFLTNANYGAGISTSYVASFTCFSTYCYAAGLLVSPTYSTQRSAAEMVTELAAVANTEVFWSEGLLKAVPYADANVSGSLYTPQYTFATTAHHNALFSSTWTSMAYGGAKYCIVSTGGNYAVSSNLTSFSTGNLAGANIGNVGKVIYVGGNFLAAGYNPAKAVTSPDGLTWAQHTFPFPLGTVNMAAASSSLIVAVASGGGFSNYATSFDGGVTWVARSFANARNVPSIAASASKVVIAFNNSGGTSFSSVTTDGISWSANSATGLTGSVTLNITYSSRLDKFVGVGSPSSSFCATSSDGLVWEVGSMPSSSNWHDVIDDGNTLIAFGSTSTAATSDDGLHWNAQTMPGVIASSSWFGPTVSSVGNSAVFGNIGGQSTVEINTTFNTCVVGPTYTYAPNTSPNYSLTDDDFLPFDGGPVRVTRKQQSDAYNVVQVEILDRDNEYNPTVIEAKDQANIELYGQRVASMVQAHQICTRSVGRNVAQLMLQRSLYIRNEYEFIVGWKYARLEPMDLVAITDTAMGLSALTVRITDIEENENGDLRILAEDFGFGTAATYTTQTGNGFSPNNAVSAGNAATPIIFQPPVTLTGTPQVWIGAAGSQYWGGAGVFVSTDGGSSYTQVATVPGPARYGTLTANLPVGADPDTVNTLAVNLSTSNGSLESVSNSQADGYATISYVDGEVVSYATANLTANYSYNCTYLRRGGYSTPISQHLTGSSFVRMDDALAKVDVSPSWVGTTMYVKLVSYNVFGYESQSLADVSATTYLVRPVDLTPADGIFTLISSTQRLIIPANQQYTVVGGMEIDGEVLCYGELKIL